jgi:hypothetical protein
VWVGWLKWYFMFYLIYNWKTLISDYNFNMRYLKRGYNARFC